MYDSCFDGRLEALPRLDRGVLWSVRIAAGALTVLAGWADAQMPNVPVLQNVWATPGIVGALDIAGGSGGSVYAAAGSWTPGSGRFQLSGGAGLQARSASGAAGAGSSWAYGARVALPLASPTGDFGFGAFVGIGGGRLARKANADTLAPDTTVTATLVPIGVAVGWRRAIGATHGVSLYASPSYVWASGGGRTAGVIRTAIGADVGVTSSIGVTAGIELGQTKATTGAPRGTLYGLGVSYAIGRR